jgi:hypothetical protein
MFDMVKDIEINFAKGPGGQSILHDADGHAPLWKKKYIFWELEYWKFLEVHPAIDVMHVTTSNLIQIRSARYVFHRNPGTIVAIYIT